MNPLVSFVVPCYKLAHLLGECVSSILGQTYTNFEIIIMDDCSPDETPRVAQSFADSRVKYVRNEPNLGHLRNYNKGIALAEGNYVWLISADDRLRVPYVLERYVDFMEKHPEAGYACSPAVELKDGMESGRAEYSFLGDQDRIFRSEEMAARLARGNCVIAAAGMVRKAIYQAWGAFPLDLPYAGDWYLWALFALHSDVAYLAEPMVNYRIHGGSMTSALMEEKVRQCQAEDVLVLWRLVRKAQEARKTNIAKQYLAALAAEYARQLVAGKYRSNVRLALDEFSTSLNQHAPRPSDAWWVESRACGFAADRYFHQGSPMEAAEMYRRALAVDFCQPVTQVKSLLLRAGRAGAALRHGIYALRRSAAHSRSSAN